MSLTQDLARHFWLVIIVTCCASATAQSGPASRAAATPTTESAAASSRSPGSPSDGLIRLADPDGETWMNLRLLRRADGTTSLEGDLLARGRTWTCRGVVHSHHASTTSHIWLRLTNEPSQCQGNSGAMIFLKGDFTHYDFNWLDAAGNGKGGRAGVFQEVSGFDHLLAFADQLPAGSVGGTQRQATRPMSYADALEEAHYSRRSDDDALPRIREALEAEASKGNVEAMVWAGFQLSTASHPTVRDYRQAIAWYTLAASRQNTTAMYNLFGLYSTGPAWLRDHALAEQWRKRAAGLGHAKAQAEGRAAERRALSGSLMGRANTPEDLACLDVRREEGTTMSVKVENVEYTRQGAFVSGHRFETYDVPGPITLTNRCPREVKVIVNCRNGRGLAVIGANTRTPQSDFIGQVIGTSFQGARNFSQYCDF
ncbi:MAG: sel1 repeat family protein [Rhizobacter sp.]|nr:sel1 repeat family protein [Rhizobacter sp.]